MPDEKKNVVYLLGTGASHAIIKHFDRTNDGILMPDIAEDVLSACKDEEDVSLRDLSNIPWLDEEKKYRNVDIESIITLYESSGTFKDKERTNKLRNYFRKSIYERIKRGLRNGNRSPNLIAALIDMYSLPDFKDEEELCAIITLNYDNFIEKAMFENFESLNIPFEVIPEHGEITNNTNIPVLCKLHGSFNWANTNPVTINEDLISIDDDKDKILWVPPGVIKRNDHYPFNAIWGAARQCLKCDVLRIIGCSLNINDFSVLSLLHTTNRLRQGDHTPKYEIQFIDYLDSHKNVSQNFPYLNIQSVIDIPEFIDYIQVEYSLEWGAKRGDNDVEKIESWLKTPNDNVNVFEIWLKAMGYSLLTKRGKIDDTKKGFFEKFYIEEL